MDLTGQRFGRLTVRELVKRSKSGAILWRCVCDCGNVVDVFASNLRSKDTVSCGCYRRDMARRIKTTHGGKGTRLYNIWHGIKLRCLNASDRAYENYGGRGITVCDEWRDSFEAFHKWAMANGYRENLTIDRSDNDGNYCPENCRWVTIAEQNRNRRFCYKITHNGQTHTLAEWSKLTGILEETLRKRIKTYGWSVERALTTQKGEGHGNHNRKNNQAGST